MEYRALTDEEATALVKLFGGTIVDGIVIIPNKGMEILSLLKLIGDIRIEQDQ